MMMKRIAAKEFLEMTRDGRFRWAAGIVLTLLTASLVMGWSHYQDVSAQHAQAREATRKDWLSQQPKNPHAAAHYGIYAFKPRLPLSLVDQGIDPYTGVAAWLEAHKQNEFRFKPAQDATAAQRFGELTGATVMQLLIPLLVILLCFGAFAAEREQGTLRQLLSLGLRPRDLAMGKALGIAAALGSFMVPAAIVGAVALVMATDRSGIGLSLPRVMWLSAGYLAYFAIFIAVALVVSGRARTARTALLALLGFWILNGLLAPRLAADVSKRLTPTPSAFEFAQQIERGLKNGLDGQSSPEKRDADLRARLLQQYRVASVDRLPINIAGASLQAGEEWGNQIFDASYTSLWRAFRRQHVIQQAMGLAAPFLAIRSLSMGLSGTDFEQHRDFAAAAETYRRGLIQTMNDAVAGHAEGYSGDAALWSRVAPFEYRAPSVTWVLSNERWTLMALAIWLIGACLVAASGIRRLQIL